MNNSFVLTEDSFNIFEEFGIKLIYKDKKFFKGKNKYFFKKNEKNPNTKEKYLFYINKEIGEKELLDILFSLEAELNLGKYDLLEDIIGKIKIKLSFILKNKEIEMENFEGVSNEVVKKIKDYKIKNIFKYRKFIKKSKENKNIELKNEKEILDELYKSFYNFIYHIGIEYQRNFSKNYTQNDFKKVLNDYSIKKGEKNKKILITQDDVSFFDKDEVYLKDKLQLDLFRKKIIEKSENNTLNYNELYDYISYIYAYVYEYPSIYQDSDNKNNKKLEDSNFIDLVDNKQLMCLTKNSLLYGLLSGIKGLEFSANLEPHHITSNISFKDSKGIQYNYYLEPTLFGKLSVTKNMNDNLGKFNINLILTKDKEYLKESNILTGKAKNILFSSHIANLMYNLVYGKKVNKKEIKILKEVFKYSIMSEPNNYIAYRALGVGYIKYGKTFEKKGNGVNINNSKAIELLKKSLQIYPLDYLSWKEMGLLFDKYSKIRLITSLVFNTNKGKMDMILQKYSKSKNYKKYNVSEEEFEKIIKIFQEKEFNKLLEYLPEKKDNE